ncbi:MAG: competence protein ComA [Thermoplasmatales archaeon SG8-52-3]|nr:MAG: competence protein ComA [Thermoplasmatales archaeon SG8-52-3]
MILNNKEILEKISIMLKEKGQKIAIAESCTGGLISHSFTNISGSSEYFDRGIVSYSNKAKTELLDVSLNILNKYGAVSEQVAKAMAEGVRKKSKVDIGIATTGIAGPTGGTKDKQVGLVFISISTINNTIVKRFQFSGNRLKNKESTCKAALEMLFNLIS